MRNGGVFPTEYRHLTPRTDWPFTRQFIFTLSHIAGLASANFCVNRTASFATACPLSYWRRRCRPDAACLSPQNRDLVSSGQFEIQPSSCPYADERHIATSFITVITDARYSAIEGSLPHMGLGATCPLNRTENSTYRSGKSVEIIWTTTSLCIRGAGFQLEYFRCWITRSEIFCYKQMAAFYIKKIDVA